jgi:haloacetate dehalogenase
MAEFRRCFRKATVIAAACADYRAGVASDLAHDDDDRAADRRVACPLLALWGAEESDSGRHDYLAIWRGWADQVTGRALECGHFLMEEAPDETAAALAEFFAGGAEHDRAGG